MTNKANDLAHTYFDNTISTIGKQIYLIFKNLMRQRSSVNEKNGLFFPFVPEKWSFRSIFPKNKTVLPI